MSSKEGTYQNLGLTYFRDKDWVKARKAYEKSLEDDSGNNRSYVTIAGSVLNDIETKLKISGRTRLLCEMEEKTFFTYKNDLEYVVELCKESITIDYCFEDPFYKIAQAYTYLFLGNRQEEDNILEAKKYLNKLQRRGFSRDGYKFVLRNMYEALGDIDKAREINNTIKPTNSNDVERIHNMYENYLVKIEGSEVITESTMQEILSNTSKNNLVDDYNMLYNGLEIAKELLRKSELSYGEWSSLHAAIKDYLVDKPNRDSGNHTVYTNKIYDWLEEIFEEINRLKPSNEISN